MSSVENDEQLSQQSLKMNGSDGVAIGDCLLPRLKELASSCPCPTQIDSANGAELSFSTLLRQTVEAARAFRARGFRSGDVIAMFSLDDTCPLFLGALFEGLSIVCIEPTWREEELRHALAVVRPRLVLSDCSRLPIAMAAASSDTLHVVTSGDCAGQDRSLLTFLQAGGSGLLEDEEYVPANIAHPEEHVALIEFTSGSTGQPKAVVHTHSGIYMSALHPRIWKTTITPGERFKVDKSMSWLVDALNTLALIAAGSTRVVANETDEFELLRVLQTYKVTSFSCSPSQLLPLAALVGRLASEGRRPDLSSVKLVRCAGALLSAKSQQDAIAKLGFPVLQLFGTTETGCIAYDTMPPHLGSVGKPLPWVTAKLVDINSQREITGPGTAGELRVKTPGIMRFYKHNFEETREAFDDEGFFRVGDLAYRDEEGRLFIVDRLKNFFKYDCIQVSPAEIESVLLEQPGVSQACVSSRPHQWLGEVPTALVVRAPGSGVTAEELQALVKGRLSDAKQLRGGVLFVDDIPVTRVGKINRAAVKKQLLNMPFTEESQSLPAVNQGSGPGKKSFCRCNIFSN